MHPMSGPPEWGYLRNEVGGGGRRAVRRVETVAWPRFQPSSGLPFRGGFLVAGHLHSQAREVMDPSGHGDNQSRSSISPEEPLFGNELRDSRGHV